MGKFLCGAAANLLPLQTPEYYNLTGRLRGNITESNRLIKMPVAGVFSNWAIYADATGTGRTANFRKDTGGGPADGNMAPVITDSVAGAYRCSGTQTDSVNAGDYVDFALTQTPSTTTWYWSAMTFEATTGHVGLYTYTGVNVSGFGTTRYVNIDGDASGSTTESDVAMVCRVAGVRSSLAIQVSTNNVNGTTTITSQVNGVDGNMSFTVPSGSGNGYFEYTGGGSDTFNAGDTLSTKIVTTGSSGSLITNFISTIITASSGTASDMFCYARAARAASATVHYYPPVGTFTVTNATSETERRVTPGFAGIIRNFRVRFSANTYTGSATVTLRKNGVDQIILTVGTLVTTLVEDAVSTLSLNSTDDISISVVGGTANSATIAYFAYTLDAAPMGRAFNINQAVNRASFF